LDDHTRRAVKNALYLPVVNHVIAEVEGSQVLIEAFILLPREA
jgi:hypothetical protein